jgi:ABC-type uncharacterized transport system permease subunit
MGPVGAHGRGESARGGFGRGQRHRHALPGRHARRGADGARGRVPHHGAIQRLTFGVVSGRGWIAIALVVFGRWDPWRSAGAALLFAFVDALQLRLQASGLGHIPYEAFLMLPFVLTIVAMAFMSRNAVAPSALLKPFRKEER